MNTKKQYFFIVYCDNVGLDWCVGVRMDCGFSWIIDDTDPTLSYVTLSEQEFEKFKLWSSICSYEIKPGSFAIDEFHVTESRYYSIIEQLMKMKADEEQILQKEMK